MNKLKFYKGLTIGMLLLNIAMVVAFFITKPPHSVGERGMLPHEFFDFEESQYNQFIADLEQHQVKMNSKKKRQIELLKPFFNSLIETSNKEDLDQILIEVQSLEKERIEELYRHFKAIRDNLTDEQKPKFGEFMRSRIERILSGDRNRRRPRKK